jgi:hypothetical protein
LRLQGRSDDDIRLSETTNTLLVDMQVPMTRAQARQFNFHVRSFEMTLSIGFENILLFNDLIIINMHGDEEEDVG